MSGDSIKKSHDWLAITKKQFLVIALTISVITATAGAGTYTLFQDRERGHATVTAGTLDLTLDGPGGTAKFTARDVMPGDSGTERVKLQNQGSISGNVTLRLDDIRNKEGQNPEAETDSAPPGELGDFLEVTVILQNETGNQTLYSGSFSEAFNNTTIATNTSIAPGKETTLFFKWRLPWNTSNTVQGDRLVANYTVLLTQSQQQSGSTRPGGPDDGDGGPDEGGDGKQTPTTATVQQVGDTARITPNGSTTSFTATLPEFDLEVDSGIGLTRLNVSFATAQSSNLTVRQRRGVPLNVNPISGNRRSLTYFEVAHPQIPEDKIKNATFTVRVRKVALGGDPSSFAFARYDEGSWNTLDTTLVRSTSTHYIFRVRSPGLSPFAALIEDVTETEGARQPDAITDVTLIDQVDIDEDGALSAFNLRIQANTSLLGFDGNDPGDPKIEVWINGTNVHATHVQNKEEGTFVVSLIWGTDTLTNLKSGNLDLKVRLVDDDTYDPSERGGDLAATVNKTVAYERISDETGVSEATYGEIARSNSVYGGMQRFALNSQWWDDAAARSADYVAETLENEIEGTIKPSATGTLLGLLGSLPNQIIKTLTKSLSRIQLVFKMVTNTFRSMEAIQRQSVAIHLKDPGYSAQTYEELHTNLEALRENGRELQAAIDAGNESRKQKLLQERKQLLAETYQTLPKYLDDVHSSIVDNAVGAEDPGAYRIIRAQVMVLRAKLITDYQATVAELPGQHTPLVRQSEMPTHGWRLADRTVLFDTMDTGNDYTVYQVTVPEETAGKTVDITVRSPNRTDVTQFNVQFTDSRPNLPATVNGEEFTKEEGADVRQYTLDDATAGTYYVVVRGDHETGSYRLTVTAGGEAVPVSVVEREGPDIQRPAVTLEEAPSKVTLENGRTVRTTTANQTPVTLAWQTWDAKTETENLQYRMRVDNGTGFSEWSTWQNVTSSGRIPYTADFDPGVHRVQLMVRDAVGRQTVRNVDVVVSGSIPSTYLAADSDPRDNKVFVKVLPDTRIQRVEFQYRPIGSDDWRVWKNISDTEGLGKLTFDREGRFEVRARAVGIAGRAGPWGSTVVEYNPPDVKSPTISVVDRPPAATNATTVHVSWQITAVDSDPTALEYRVNGRDGWSEWQSLPANGLVERTLTPVPGTHNVTVQVRDGAGNTNRETVTFEIDRDAPSITKFNASGDVKGVFLDAESDESDAYLQVEYRRQSETEWSQLGTARQNGDVLPVQEAGIYEVRVRPVDDAENTGSWQSVTVQVLSEESTVTEEQLDQTLNNESTTVGLGSGLSGGTTFTDVDLISGEALMDLYVLTRDGRELKIKSIKLTEDRNMTVAADLPPSLQNATELRIEIRNGSARLRSLRVIDADPAIPPMSRTPENPIVGEEVTLSVSTERDDLIGVGWDLDGDGTLDSTNNSITTRFQTAGKHNVTVRVTDVFGNVNTTTITVAVNAPPMADLSIPDVVIARQSAAFSAANASDSDGSVATYEWDFDADGRYETEGRTVSHAFTNAGNATITLRVTDNKGATDTITREIQVRPSPINTSLSVHGDLDAPGNRVVVQFDLQNREDASLENISLDVGDLPPGWTIEEATFDTSTRGTWNATTTAATGKLKPFTQDNRYNYERQDLMHLNLELNVPDNATIGEYRIPAVTRAGNTTLHKPIATVTVKEPETTLTVHNDTDAPGNTVVVQYDLQNREDTTIENVSLDVGDLPPGWTVEQATFDEDTRGTWNVTTTAATGKLKPFTQDNRYNYERQDLMYLNLELQVPSNASAGGYQIPVVSRAGNTTLHERTAVVTVTKPDTTLSVSNDTDAPGNTVVVQYNLQNREDTTIENVSLDVGDLPPGWTIEQATFDYDTRGTWNATATAATGKLKPFTQDNRYNYERQDLMYLNLELHVPNNTTVGEYRIPVVVKAGNTTLHERTATVTVKKPETALVVRNDTDAPGNTAIVQYNLQNREDTTIENVSLDVGDLPAGWTIKQVTFDYDTRGTWNATATAATGKLKPFTQDNRYNYERQDLMYLNLEVQIPNNASIGEYQIPVTARAAGTTLHERNATVTVKQPEMTLTVANDTDAPGNTVIVEYDLQNREDTTIENVTLDVGNLPPGWTVTHGSLPHDSSGTWDPNETVVRGKLYPFEAGHGWADRGDEFQLDLTLHIPSNASMGEYEIPVTAKAANTTLHRRNGTVTVKQPETTLTVINDTDAPGNTVVVEYNLQNREDTTIENVTLDVGELPPGWTIKHGSLPHDSSGAWDLNETVVRGKLYPFEAGHGWADRGDEFQLDLALHVPRNASMGKYRIPVTAKAANTTLYRRDATVTVKKPKTTMTVANDTDAPGNTVVVEYNLVNQEDTTIENVSLDVGDLPPGWTVKHGSLPHDSSGTWDPNETVVRGKLYPFEAGHGWADRGDEFQLDLALHVPRNASMGEYRIPVTAKAANTTLQQREASVTVKEPETTLAVSNSSSTPGNTVVVQYDLRNQEDTTIENVSLDIGDLPAGWTVEQGNLPYDSSGAWYPNETVVRGKLYPFEAGHGWGDRADEFQLDVSVRVPANASAGTYRIPVRVQIANSTVYRRNATITVT